MKLRLLSFAIVAALAAGSLFGQGLESVLTSGGSLYTIETVQDGTALSLTRRQGEERKPMLVPASEDAVHDADARLLFDRASETLFVVWRRESAAGDEIVMTSLRDGAWSNELVIAPADSAAPARNGLRVTLGHGGDENHVTFVHAVWWDRTATATARYALVAFENNEHASTFLGDLETLASTKKVNANERVPEDALPLLAISPATDGADVLFGALDHPAATRVKLTPEHKQGDAKIWIPVGRSGGAVPHPRFAAASYGGNAQVMIIGSRVVVYSAAEEFHFSVFSRGEWSPVRVIPLDEAMTAREVEAELRRAVTQDQDEATAPVIDR